MNRIDRAIQIKCPERYCFFWLDEGSCGCPFGTCYRIEADNKNKDWFEPNEPEHDKNGLPYDYFNK